MNKELIAVHVAELAEAKQHAANWEESAAQFSRNADFYRVLLTECAKHLGPDVFVCDDGSVSQDPLMLKIPQLVATLKEQGRQEALAYDPPIPPEIKGQVQAEWFWKGVLAMREQEETK